jgi:hypothetical protein
MSGNYLVCNMYYYLQFLQIVILQHICKQYKVYVAKWLKSPTSNHQPENGKGSNPPGTFIPSCEEAYQLANYREDNFIFFYIVGYLNIGGSNQVPACVWYNERMGILAFLPHLSWNVATVGWTLKFTRKTHAREKMHARCTLNERTLNARCAKR